jgi:hypothetical protein
MTTHIFGLTIAVLDAAARAARAVDHPVTLIDDATHMIVVIDKRGRVMMRADEAYGPVGSLVAAPAHG